MKYLFENIQELQHYLADKNASSNVTLADSVYLYTVHLLSNKRIRTENVFESVRKCFPRFTDDRLERLFENILTSIIDEYNTYYLDDSYYYNGYWDDEEWISTLETLEQQ